MKHCWQEGFLFSQMQQRTWVAGLGQTWRAQLMQLFSHLSQVKTKRYSFRSRWSFFSFSHLAKVLSRSQGGTHSLIGVKRPKVGGKPSKVAGMPHLYSGEVVGVTKKLPGGPNRKHRLLTLPRHYQKGTKCCDERDWCAWTNPDYANKPELVSLFHKDCCICHPRTHGSLCCDCQGRVACENCGRRNCPFLLRESNPQGTSTETKGLCCFCDPLNKEVCDWCTEKVKKEMRELREIKLKKKAE